MLRFFLFISTLIAFTLIVLTVYFLCSVKNYATIDNLYQYSVDDIVSEVGAYEADIEVKSILVYEVNKRFTIKSFIIFYDKNRMVKLAVYHTYFKVGSFEVMKKRILISAEKGVKPEFSFRLFP